MTEQSDINSRSAEDETARHLSTLLGETRDDIVHADSKASIVLAGLGIGFGALLGGLLAGNWSPSELANSVEWIWWLGLAMLVTAIVASVGSVWPRFRRRRDVLYFWGDVFKSDSVDTIVERIASSQSESARVADQFSELSKIVVRKYLLVRTALLLALIGSFMCAIAAGIDQLLGR